MTREKWYNFCMEKGTSGDQVFSILRDWLESEMFYEKKLAELNRKLDSVAKYIEMKVN